MITENTATSPHLRSLHLDEDTVRIFSEPVPYLTAWDLQSRLHQERLQNLRPDTILILEHSPVYTLGRRTRLSHWGGSESALCKEGAELHHVNRGGSVTFHGPGQIVIYPILRVNRYAAGPRHLVWLLEEVLIRLLDDWDIAGTRIIDKPGVWVLNPNPQKIAFIGIRIERGVTLHGVALNVDLDLTPFHRIYPCGLTDCPVTSMATVSQSPISIDAVKQKLPQTFESVFSLNMTGVE